ncbi:MAG: FliG C-terminal domain-containing protein [Pseudomonadota bacterium]|nr:FliG C-terminal domain-containing protein [Pseudomonadota bacterium]
MDPDSQRTLLENLAQKDATLAELIKSSLFTFDDIHKINHKSVPLLFTEIPEKMWCLALRKANDEVKLHLFSNLSARRVEQFKEAIENQGSQPLSKIQAAQKEIVDKILELEKIGKVFIVRGGDKDRMV